VIFAVGPEAEIDSRGYDAAVAQAVEQFVQLDRDWVSRGMADNMSVMMKLMKLSEMKTNDEMIAEQLRSDPEFRTEWERTALARSVAVAIVRYRAEQDLSQRELAQRLGMKQPQVARLERGEVNPSIETLVRLAGELRIEFTIDIKPVATKAERRMAADVLVGSRTPADLPVVSAK
jgi:ribosome-binding protein aMBF1 (putative translation factor)